MNEHRIRSRVEVDSPKIRGSTQTFLHLVSAFFFLGMFAELAGGVWSIFQNYVIFIPAIFLFGASFFFSLGLWIVLYSRRALFIDGKTIYVFTGFRHRQHLVGEKDKILVAIAGKGNYSLSWCVLFYHSSEFLWKYDLVCPRFRNDQDRVNYQHRIERAFAKLRDLTNCFVDIKWESWIKR